MKAISVKTANGSSFWILGFNDVDQFGEALYDVMRKCPIGLPAFVTFDILDLDGHSTVLLDVKSIQSAYLIEMED